MVFINVEKAYDKVSRDVLWRCLDARGVPMVYIREIRTCMTKPRLGLERREKTWSTSQLRWSSSGINS
uniref:Putative ovule protein n=1 Tax=Solanum chacoense TaxID=4108 RepID=A0A0V0GSE2_SOLCH